MSEKALEAIGPPHRSGGPAASSSSSANHHFPDSPDHDTEAVAEGPPPYSDPAGASPGLQGQAAATSQGPQDYPGLPMLDYRLYSPPMFELSGNGTTITGKASYLSENAKALSDLVRSLASVPPKPQIHVTGTRGRQVDFALKMNLMSLLVPKDASRRTEYLRLVKPDEQAYRGGYQPALKPDVPGGSLEGWCRRFVADESSIKTFALERVVSNLDTNWLEGQLRSLVAATGYRGVVNVQFPVTHARVVVQNPDRVNKFFTSVSALFMGKSRYEVAKSVWPFADRKSGEPGRECVVQSERAWWEEWRGPIMSALTARRKGWVTNEDKLECIMESKGKGLPTIDWGPDWE